MSVARENWPKPEPWDISPFRSQGEKKKKKKSSTETEKGAEVGGKPGGCGLKESVSRMKVWSTDKCFWEVK